MNSTQVKEESNATAGTRNNWENKEFRVWFSFGIKARSQELLR